MCQPGRSGFLSGVAILVMVAAAMVEAVTEQNLFAATITKSAPR